MSDQQTVAESFVKRLLSNPALSALTPLQREEQIHQFFAANERTLAATLTRPGFFPGSSWQEILPLLSSTLRKLVDDDFFPMLEQFLGRKITFSFLGLMGQKTVSGETVVRQMNAQIRSAMKKPNARSSMTGCHAAVFFRMLERYLYDAFERQEYIHFEITKVQRLRIGAEELKNLLLVTALLKPAVHQFVSDTETGSSRSVGVVQQGFAERGAKALQKQLPALPQAVVQAAVNANLSFLDNRYIEATARLAAILAERARYYNPLIKADRGADTPDKSWFKTAQRNAKVFGFDGRMVDELYRIAAENGW